MDKKVILRNVGKRNRSYYNNSIAIIVFCFIKTKSKLRRTFPKNSKYNFLYFLFIATCVVETV